MNQKFELSIEEPEDLISISLYNMLNYRKNDEQFINLIRNWNKKIVLHLIPFYPLAVIFWGDEIKFDRENVKKANLHVQIDLNTMLEIACGEMNPVKALLKGKLKIKGIYKIKTLLKFIKIFLDTMKIMVADPNQNYFEINKFVK
ncbi:MAG: SCP2 sterol-binding domain-containing protein [Promethearchaeota archaeon]